MPVRMKAAAADQIFAQVDRDGVFRSRHRHLLLSNYGLLLVLFSMFITNTNAKTLDQSCRSQKSEESLKACSELLSHDYLPKEERAVYLYFRGTSSANLGKYAAGISDIREALRISPTALYYRRNLGGIYASIGKSNEALRWFDDELRNNIANHQSDKSSEGTTLLVRAEIYCKMGRFDDANADLIRVKMLLDEIHAKHKQSKSTLQFDKDCELRY